MVLKKFLVEDNEDLSNAIYFYVGNVILCGLMIYITPKLNHKQEIGIFIFIILVNLIEILMIFITQKLDIIFFLFTLSFSFGSRGTYVYQIIVIVSIAMILNIDYLISNAANLNSHQTLNFCVIASWIMFIMLWSIYAYFDEITKKL